MRKFVSLVLAVSAAIMPLTVSAKEKEPKPVELTEDQLAALQRRSIQASPDLVFRSSIAALQELGYININASKDAGTITAETDAKSKLVYNIFWGFGKKKRTQVASVFVEPAAANMTRMSVKLQMVEAKARMGASYADGKPVPYAEPYNSFHAEFDKALAVRAAEAAAPAAPVAAVVPVAAPVEAVVADGPTG